MKATACARQHEPIHGPSGRETGSSGTLQKIHSRAYRSPSSDFPVAWRLVDALTGPSFPDALRLSDSPSPPIVLAPPLHTADLAVQSRSILGFFFRLR